jgi:uncharacterized phage-associated protein
MPFKLDVLKTIQAIAVLFRSDLCKEMDYLRVLKLLYIADRESLAETGRPITGDQVVAMKLGPVLSGIYDLVKSNPCEPSIWQNFLRKDHYQIELTEDPGTEELSPYEIGKLLEVAKRYKDCGSHDLVEITHEFGEWQRNNPEKSGVKIQPIPFADILAAVGRAEDVEWIRKDAAAADTFDRLIGK